MICPICDNPLIPIEGETPNRVVGWCKHCERPFFENGRSVTKIGTFMGLEVFDYGGDEEQPQVENPARGGD